MCRHQQYSVQPSVEETVTAEESLLIYCKPVELYNIISVRALRNPAILRRCLSYKIQARRKRRLRDAVVLFNYRDLNNMIQKTEVSEGFACPFCLMSCASFKGLRYHLCASHDLFKFEFWATEDYRVVNVTVKVDTLRSEIVADGMDQRLQMFFFCSKQRKRRPNYPDQNEQYVKCLELESSSSANEDTYEGLIKYYNGELPLIEKNLQSGKFGGLQPGPSSPGQTEGIEDIASSFNITRISIVNNQSPIEPEPILPCLKSRRSTVDKSDPRNRMLLQKRQFYHSHRVQPMALEQVFSDQDSEDDVDDGTADLEDKRMLDDFVDVTKDEKELMHLWNSFVRKQRVLADGHVPWACEAFSKLNGNMLVCSPALFWCWKVFMVKLWNHGLLDASTMNNCNTMLDKYRNGCFNP